VIFDPDGLCGAAYHIGPKGPREKSARLDPVAPNCALGNVQSVGRFLFGHAAEEPALDDSRQPLIEHREPVERVVKLEKRFRLIVGGYQLVVERHVAMRAPALLGRASAGAINEDVAHRDRGDAQKVRPVLPIYALSARQLEIELMHERGSGQRVAPANGQFPARSTTELVVNQGEDLIERLAPAATKIREELRDGGSMIDLVRASSCGFWVSHADFDRLST
jgi:hypothetical protein